ncbi:MAG TPA: hypothetical protein VF492_11735 [Verrucomicrobiae bacterium]
MKQSKLITGCALAAGLMAFAPIQSQALVWDNTVVSPINIKVIGTYVNDHNKIVKITYSNKDILRYADAPIGAKLALWEGDIVVISNNEFWTDLTANGVLYVNKDAYTWKGIDGRNNSYKYVETGTVEIGYGSNGNDTYDTYNYNDYGFNVTGVYTHSESGSAVNNNGYQTRQTRSEKNTTSGLSGVGYDDIDNTGDVGYGADGYMPVTATVSSSGSGKVVLY